MIYPLYPIYLWSVLYPTFLGVKSKLEPGEGSFGHPDSGPAPGIQAPTARGQSGANLIRHGKLHFNISSTTF